MKIKVGHTEINTVEVVKYLGVNFGRNMNMGAHVVEIVKRVEAVASTKEVDAKPRQGKK